MAGRTPLWLIGALALSLAVNLAGLGYLATTPSRPDKSRRSIEDTIAFISARYPAGVNAAVEAALEARRDELGRALAEMREARRATRDAMSAEPLDTARVEASFAAARAKGAAFQTVIHTAIVAALPKATPEDRRKIDRDGRD